MTFNPHRTANMLSPSDGLPVSDVTVPYTLVKVGYSFSDSNLALSAPDVINVLKPWVSTSDAPAQLPDFYGTGTVFAMIISLPAPPLPSTAAVV